LPDINANKAEVIEGIDVVVLLVLRVGNLGMNPLALVCGVGDCAGRPFSLVIGVGDGGGLPLTILLIIPVLGLLGIGISNEFRNRVPVSRLGVLRVGNSGFVNPVLRLGNVGVRNLLGRKEVPALKRLPEAALLLSMSTSKVWSGRTIKVNKWVNSSDSVRMSTFFRLLVPL
jgi:hypothetical protein